MTFSPPRYHKGKLADFYPTLRARVNDYFTERNLSHHANAAMIVKTVVLLLVYFIPYVVMLAGWVTNPWIVIGLWGIMGLGMAGLGMSVMHDANHGAYSRYKWVNNVMGSLLNILGGNAAFWKIQHNVLHHTYTNVEGTDEDIAAPGVLRFSPHAKRRGIHRFQHLYAWFLYGMMTLPWFTSKELSQLFRYRKMGLIKSGKPWRNLLIQSIVWKLVYYTYAIILPLLFIPAPWWVILIGFALMHYVAGFLLGMIFQTAHVMPTSEFPQPDEAGTLENNWAVHQLLTTTNYAPKSRIMSWYVGGLNFQIEHHLFPNICHIHYKKISRIVAETAQEFGLPYHSQRNFFQAVREHARMLYVLGHTDSWQPQLAPVRS